MTYHFVIEIETPTFGSKAVKAGVLKVLQKALTKIDNTLMCTIKFGEIRMITKDNPII